MLGLVLASWGCGGLDEPTPEDGLTATEAVDADRDGFAVEDDCDDSNDAVHPNADELCDGLDNDCNGEIDDEPPWSAFYQDADGDGFGEPTSPIHTCEPPSGYVASGTDCDDADPRLHPETQWYADLDGDGYGSEPSGVGCEAPLDSSLDDGDCDEDDAAISPGASEVCNAVDDDCNGTIDDDALNADTWYLDGDGDGYGDEAKPYLSCSEPDGYLTQGLDCDDADQGIHPGATEDCFDDIDSDCTGRIDNGCLIVSVADAEWAWGATAEDDRLGWSTANLGDLDGDGKDDLGVTAPYAENSSLSAAGAVYVISGTTTTGQYLDVGTEATATIFGDTVNDQLGQVVGSAGDVNGDGVPDLIVGSLNSDGYSCAYCGDSRLFLGPVVGVLGQMDADAGFANANTHNYFGDIATRGDFDGDGQDDLVIGGSRSTEGVGLEDTLWGGLVYFFSGPDVSGELTPEDADATFIGDPAAYSGSGISTLQDANGDGISDLAVGSLGYAAEGLVSVLFGPIEGELDASMADVTYTPADFGDMLGYRAGWAGDVDGDGHLDLVASATYANDGGTSAGAAYLIDGPFDESQSVTEADATMFGTAGDAFGSSLCEGADIDGDGKADLALGSQWNDAGAPNAGVVAVFLGPIEGARSSASAELLVQGTEDAYAGTDVDLLDFDGDGAMDVALGAFGSDDRGLAAVIGSPAF